MTSLAQEKMSKPLLSNATDVTIGIDISKDRLDAHAHPAGTVRPFANDRAGLAALLA